MSGSPSQQRIVVTGASGLIGSALVRALEGAGHPVTRLVRRQPGPSEVFWNPGERVIDDAAIDGAWAVVHLAGEGIAEKKWSDEQKKRILESRTDGTHVLAQAIARVPNPPSVFASGSAIGIYGDRGDEVLDESSARGTGFLADVVDAWEAATAPAEQRGVRTVHLRTGIVLSTRGGALKQQLLPFKLGLGGRLGSGRQYLPWISIDDEVAAIRHVLVTESLRGAVNLVGPEPATNAEFTKALGRALKRPTLIPIPLFPLKALYGEELVREMLLGGARVRPSALVASGFTFRDPDLGTALSRIISQGI